MVATSPGPSPFAARAANRMSSRLRQEVLDTLELVELPTLPAFRGSPGCSWRPGDETRASAVSWANRCSTFDLCRPRLQSMRRMSGQRDSYL
jgi:hypothetical protein